MSEIKFDRKVAIEIESALHEAAAAYNAAKKVDAQTVTLSRRACYLLAILASQLIGIPAINGATGLPIGQEPVQGSEN